MLARAISIPYGSSARASSSAYVHTPPIGSTVTKILRADTLEVCVLINRIDGRRDLDDPFNFRVKRRISRQAACPFHCRAPKPLVRRRGQVLGDSRNKSVRQQNRRRSRSRFEFRAAFRSVKRRFDLTASQPAGKFHEQLSLILAPLRNRVAPYRNLPQMSSSWLIRSPCATNDW